MQQVSRNCHCVQNTNIRLSQNNKSEIYFLSNWHLWYVLNGVPDWIASIHNYIGLWISIQFPSRLLDCIAIQKYWIGHNNTVLSSLHEKLLIVNALPRGVVRGHVLVERPVVVHLAVFVVARGETAIATGRAVQLLHVSLQVVMVLDHLSAQQAQVTRGTLLNLGLEKTEQLWVKAGI
jgi:hypothetical protein